MSFNILAIDPGNVQSAFCVIDMATLRPLAFDKLDNAVFRSERLDSVFSQFAIQNVAIEMLACFGQIAGKTMFDTCVEIGRLTEIFTQNGITPYYIYRKEEVKHICGNTKAGDANIRHALVARFAESDRNNGKGTKDKPDWFYGFHDDIWQAYAVGITYIETVLKKEQERND